MKRFALTFTLSLSLGAVLMLMATRPVAGQDHTFAYSSHEDVSQAQGILENLQLLAPNSYKSGEVDGPTTHALLRFQQDHNLLPTGEVDWETMTQLLSHRPPLDSDGDGVPDRRDKCPNTPHGATVDENGCPKDADGDGVFDGLDKCPDTPRGAKVDNRGCPLDSDQDGVYDGLDRCPDTPRGVKVDERGCPWDADGDNVPDYLDKCPDTPRGVKVDSNGCPTDSDGDGVPDYLDKCPDTPRGVKVDASGCPEQVATPPAPPPLALPELKKHLVLEGVYFETNSAKLKSESTVTLDRLVKALKENPDARIEVEGHTDSTGSARINDPLSRARAKSVRDYLISNEIDASRLEANGYGSTRPIADNKTKAGRAENRRVELVRLH